MARTDFDRLHSVEVIGDRFLIRAVAGRTLIEFSFDREAIALLIPNLQRAQTTLPPEGQRRMLIAMGFQPILSPMGEPGIEIALSEQLSIPLVLGQLGLAGLRACIDQLQPDSQTGASKH